MTKKNNLTGNCSSFITLKKQLSRNIFPSRAVSNIYAFTALLMSKNTEQHSQVPLDGEKYAVQTGLNTKN